MTGRTSEALADAEKALEYASGFSELENAHNMLARAYEALGRKDEAIEHYKMTLIYNNHFDEAKNALNRLGVKPE